MPKLRTPPSGPEIVGTFPGQALTWDGADWIVSGDLLRLVVPPTYSSSNQTVKIGQPVKAVASVVDVAVAVTDRFVEKRGSNFELVDGTVGPIRWLGTGGTYSLIGFSWTAAYLNASVDVTTNPFYFGMKSGGSTPMFAQPRWLKATLDPRDAVSITGSLFVLNGGQAASVIWPVISGAGALVADALGWTEQNLEVWDTGYRA